MTRSSFPCVVLLLLCLLVSFAFSILPRFCLVCAIVIALCIGLATSLARKLPQERLPKKPFGPLEVKFFRNGSSISGHGCRGSTGEGGPGLN